MEKVTKKKILLAGAAGRIGTALTLGLKDSYELYLADIKPQEAVAGKDKIYQSDRYFQIDLSKREEVDGLFSNLPQIDALVHFAASWKNLDDILKNMLTSTAYLTEVAVDHGVSKYIYPSTSDLYESPQEVRWDTWPLVTHRTVSYYRLAKIWIEHHAKMLSDAYGVSTIGLRIGNFTPEREDLSDLKVYQRKRVLISKDAVQLVKKSIENEKTLCEVFEVTSWPPDTPGVLLDTSRAKRVLGYEPSLRWED